MQVVQLCLRFHPAPGGVETHVLELSKRLLARGHQVRVLTSDLLTETPRKKLPKDRMHEMVAGGIEVERFRSISLPGVMHYTMFPSIADRLKDVEADVFHAHSYGYYHVNAAVKVRKERDVPLVLTTHFHPVSSITEGKGRKVLRKVYDERMGKKGLRACDSIICVSKAEAEELGALDVDAEKVHVIPNGVDMARFDTMPSPDLFRERSGIDAPFIMFAGRLAPNKRLDVLVDAMAHVVESESKVHLVIIGGDGGAMKETRARIKKLGLDNRVHVLGHMDDDEMFRSAYAASEMLALSSDFEAFGIVLAEAMAAGKPCVSTRVGGTTDVVEDGRTGLLVPPGDAKGMAKALLELLEDPERRKRMGEAGRERVRAKFTWDIVAEQVELVYKSII